MWLQFAILPMVALTSTQSPPNRPARTYDLIHLKVDLGLDFEKRAISGTATNLLKPLRPGTKKLVFDCAKLKVAAVRVNRKAVRFEQQGESLTVHLATAAGPKDALSVDISYSGRPEAGLYFVRKQHAFPAKSAVVFTQGECEDTRHWIPTYDYPDDRTTTETVIRVPKNNFVLSNGKLVEVRKGADTWTYHWRMDQPHSTYLISVVAGDYVQGREKWGTLPVDWYVPRGLEEEGRGAFAGTADMVKFFSELTGLKYPFAKYSQSAVPDFMFGGMENTTCTTQTIRCLHHPDEHPLEDWSGLVLHELAHQWFGDTVTCATWSHIWINEGFATFLPSFYVRKRDGEDAFHLSRYGTFQGGFGGMMAANRPMVSTKYQIPMDMFDGNAYPGGASRMFMLMHELGEKVFWKSVTDFLHAYKHKNATTEQFFASVGKSSGKNLDAFRKQWFYTAGAPKLKLSREGEDIIITQTAPLFNLKTQIAFWQNGKWTRRPVTIAGPTTKVPATDFSNASYILDPDVWIMGQIDYSGELSGTECAELFVSGVNGAQRARLLDRVGNRLSQQQVADLLEWEKLVDLRTRLVGLLGAGSENLLLRLLDHPDKRIVNAAIAKWAGMPADDEAKRGIQSVWTTSRSQALRQTALSTLLAWSQDLSVAEEALNTPSLHDSFRMAGLGKICEKDPERGRMLCLAILTDDSSEPLRIEAVRRLGGLKDANGSTAVFDGLVATLENGSFNARRTAIDSLKQYGDKRAIAHIQPFLTHGMHFMRRVARSAVDELGKLP
ncbi:MAG: hypothetical protein HONBIEJF_01637 [Fimbriimonadaceae bacterium]|nr:hypothetical protein [Fimbriimonadaceae bacterium]